MLIDDDGLVDVDRSDRGIVDRLQPTGDSNGSPRLVDRGATARDAGDHGSRQAIDGVRADAQQSRTVRVESGCRTRFLEYRSAFAGLSSVGVIILAGRGRAVRQLAGHRLPGAVVPRARR